MGAFKRPTWMGGDPPALPPTPNKAEGKEAEIERLAILLACGHDVSDARPRNRVELLADWEDKRPGTREGYRLRAKRLLEAWGEDDRA